MADTLRSRPRLQDAYAGRLVHVLLQINGDRRPQVISDFADGLVNIEPDTSIACDRAAAHNP